MLADEQTKTQIIAMLERLGSLIAAKDRAVLAEFASDADVLLVGSDAEEIAAGPQAIEALLGELFQAPISLSWEWRRSQVSAIGDVAWIFADGELAQRRDNDKGAHLIG